MRQHDIIFLAAYGEEYKVVKLASPNGSGSNCYHIMMDDFYFGMLVKRFKWDVCFQNYTDQYTQAELDTLIEKLSSITDVER